MSDKLGDKQLLADRTGVVRDAHPTVSRLFGLEQDEFIGKPLMSLIAAHDRDGFQSGWSSIIDGQTTVVYTSMTHASGAVLPARFTRLESKDDELILSSVEDLSQRRGLEDQLVEMREHYELLSETTTDAILQIDNDLIIVFANSAAEKIFGFDRSEMVGSSLGTIFPDNQYTRYRKQFRKYFVIDESDRLTTGMRNVMEALARKSGGDMIPVEISMGNSKGVGTNRVLTCIIRDITLRKKADRRLHYLAYHDKLTSLGNRDRFSESLNRILKDVHANSGRHAALLYLDLDGFKKINDSLGHEIGDAILKACAKRLGNCLRDGDQVYRFDFEEIFRLGGDEFTILLPYIKKPEDAAIVARRVISTLTHPFSIEGWESIKNIRLGVSIGIALMPRDGKDKTTLLRNADSAMYKAKEKGNSYVFFAEAMNDMAMERLLMEEGIRQALSSNEFELHYQPIVDKNKKVVSIEALIRWNHPKRGLLYPDRFIPLAEDTDLINPLGTWVLSTACKQLKSLQALGHPDLSVSVNIAPSQLEQRDFSDTIGNILARNDLDPKCLRLELTETTVMENPERSRQKIDMIKAMNEGISVAIDDFGTGYSSLAYLTRYAVDYLKIDKSFVTEMTKSENSKLVKTIIDLGISMGLSVVAEGVETAEQFALLTFHNCTLFQGYLISKPISFRAIARYLRESADQGE
jgi:diguanylate cyclase (GGDEF)-like protein/PAS domain S-box-containing protein